MGIDIKTIFDLGVEESVKKEIKTLRFYPSHGGVNTTAVEEGHEFDGINLILKKYPFVDRKWLLSKKRYRAHDKLIATAICHEDDTPDEEKGKRAALKKLNVLIKGRAKSVLKLFERDMNRRFTNGDSQG